MLNLLKPLIVNFVLLVIFLASVLENPTKRLGSYGGGGGGVIGLKKNWRVKRTEHGLGEGADN